MGRGSWARTGAGGRAGRGGGGDVLAYLKAGARPRLEIGCAAAAEESARREVRAVVGAIQRGRDGWGALAWPGLEPVADVAAVEMSWHTLEQSRGPGGRSAAAEKRARREVRAVGRAIPWGDGWGEVAGSGWGRSRRTTRRRRR